MEKYSPRRAPDNPSELGRDAHVKNNLPGNQERPEGRRDERTSETCVQSRGNGPGGQEGEQAEPLTVERDDRMRDNDGDGSHSTHGPYRDDGNRGDDDINAPCRDLGRGGQGREKDELNAIEDDQDYENDGDGIGYNGTRTRTDGATSGACSDSTREKHQRGPTHLPNPPRRRGKLKSNATRVSSKTRATVTV